MDARYIEVNAAVRYWEDAFVNGKVDERGVLIPFRFGDMWKPVIRLSDGFVLNWPEGTEADIHYKICDAGEYWLHEESGNRIAKWKDHYVPTAFLCHGDNGYGDYIIIKVGMDGKIVGWNAPEVDADDWHRLM